MEWLREERYAEADKKGRQHFHIQPSAGSLKKPAGFVYHDGLYHLFYEWLPARGLKYWYHISSPDLIRFVTHGPVVIMSDSDERDCKMEQKWDDGFDFDAPQLTQGPEGEQILVGWIGGSEPCFTVPRLISIEEGKTRQRPHPLLERLRGEPETAEGYAMKHDIRLHPYEGDCYELIIDILENESTEFYIELRVSRREATRLIYNHAARKFTLDRFDSGLLTTNSQDFTRSVILETPLQKIHAFVDQTSIEIFLNDGEKVMTSRIFPSDSATGIRTSTESGQVYLKFTKYDIEKQDV
ncbi:GH32 C-terminal domain-containing protein [Macrococcus bovicus]|nr:GH32 C-terminal domain-containing protein [Macrococcus bovicus]WJP97541.1 GH32 C-terminal domain-containing protein [Macrococcus bovicus]